MAVRLTLDWDFKNRIKALWYLAKIWKHGFEALIVEKSRNKGYHVQVWVTGRMSQGRKDWLRSIWGEDPAHLRMDKKHRIGKQTLFDDKRRLTVLKGGRKK